MTKREAKRKAKFLRAQGKVVTILCERGVYTQPGRGLVAYEIYSLKIEDQKSA